MMLFAIVFGLSMDYESSPVAHRRSGTAPATARESWPTARGDGADHRRCGDHGRGLRQLPLSHPGDPLFGRPVAVLLDATVSACCCPATMELLGDRNWWIPWMDRVLQVSVEGPTDTSMPSWPRSAVIAASEGRKDVEVS
jgi:RND superfamily putative drug exporter